jgi:hypothetical protein
LKVTQVIHEDVDFVPEDSVRAEILNSAFHIEGL